MFKAHQLAHSSSEFRFYFAENEFSYRSRPFRKHILCSQSTVFFWKSFFRYNYMKPLASRKFKPVIFDSISLQSLNNQLGSFLGNIKIRRINIDKQIPSFSKLVNF